jgi:hypothetical protein
VAVKPDPLIYQKGELTVKTTRAQHIGWIRILLALIFVLSPLSAQAAGQASISAQQDSDYKPILLGEYVQREMLADEVAGYAIFVPESGLYMVTPDDEVAAESFDIVIYDEADEIVFEGMLLDAVELELESGAYILEITAAYDDLLSFFFLGMIGTMSDSDREPGNLYPGSLYIEERINEERYATLSIPALGYPIQVLIYTSGGEEDVFSVSAEGDDIGYRYTYTSDSDLLSFWSEGGDYLITVQPQERRSELSLVIFISGQPKALSFDEPLEASLVVGNDMLIYELVLDTFYDEVTVELEGTSEEGDLQLMVVDSLYSAEQSYYSYEDDGVQLVEMENLFPGVYYVMVSRYSIEDESGYILTAGGEEGEPLTRLESGEAAAGEIVSGQQIYYEFEVSQPGAMITVDLSSDVEEADFDLAVGLSLQSLPWSSATSGPNERVTFMAPAAGLYYVEVNSYSGEGAYELTAEEGDLALEVFTGEVTEGSVEDDGTVSYRLAIDEPGQILTVLLVGSGETDLDLYVTLYGVDGESLSGLSSTTFGSTEIVAQAGASAGVYEVSIRAYGAGDDFRLLARVEDAEELLSVESE